MMKLCLLCFKFIISFKKLIDSRFCTGLAFYTFAQYLGSIGGDIFTAVAVTGIISSLGGLTCVYVVTKVGRKTALELYQGITGICFILLLLQPESKLRTNWERLLFAGIGFGGMAVSRYNFLFKPYIL